MKIIRASHLGMCFGVRDAIELALDEASARPTTVLGDLVHNEIVLAQLQEQGIQIAQHLRSVQTQSVMITAHGASQKAISAAERRGHSAAGGDLPAGACGRIGRSPGWCAKAITR